METPAARRRRKQEEKEKAKAKAALVPVAPKSDLAKGSFLAKALTPGASWDKDSFPDFPDVRSLRPPLVFIDETHFTHQPLGGHSRLSTGFGCYLQLSWASHAECSN